MKINTDYLQTNPHKSYRMDFSMSTLFARYSQSNLAATAPISMWAHISGTLWRIEIKFDGMLRGSVPSAGKKSGVISSLGGAVISKTLFLFITFDVFLLEMKLWYLQILWVAPLIVDADISR